MSEERLTLGLPHTNLNALAEPQLFMQAGHFQWNAIARGLGRPLSQLKTREGKTIYAAYSYIELDLPADRPLNSFRLDETLIFWNRLRHYKSMAMDGCSLFDREAALTGVSEAEFERDPSSFRGRHPLLRMCNVFIAREKEGNDYLKIATPDQCSFAAFAKLPPEDHTYSLTREAGESKTFGLVGPEWTSLDRNAEFAVDYRINPDRDSNGAGLVYFANYIAFFDQAERQALTANCRQTFSAEEIHGRSTLHRRIAYFSNASLEETLRIQVRLFESPAKGIGVRAWMNRVSDGRLVALTEVQKAWAPWTV